jgi:hypothetical protein
MLQGILDIYEACKPDRAGFISVDSLRTGTSTIFVIACSSELANRATGYNIGDLLKVLPVHNHRLLTFIDLWEKFDTALLSDADSSFDDDEIRSLKSLRNQVIRELRLCGEGSQLSHSRLIIILGRVRDDAVNKTTWDDAIESAGGQASSPSKMHSLSTLSKAIKVMLEEYLKASEATAEWIPADGPPVDDWLASCSSERFNSLASEIDELKDRLTESECKLSSLLQENEILVDECSRLRREALRQKSIEEELAESRQEVRALQVKLDMQRGSETSSEVKRLQEKLELFEMQQKEEVSREQLMSQIHTLEVQKADAEAEITRLKRAECKAVESSSRESTRPPSVISSQRFGGLSTVSICGVETRRSSIADEFLHPQKRMPPIKRIKNKKAQDCVQQYLVLLRSF